MKTLHSQSRSAYTLLELMFVVMVLMVLSGTILSTFLYLSKAGHRLLSYRSVHASAHRALSIMSDDIRNARIVSISSPNSLSLRPRETEDSHDVYYALKDNILTRSEGTASRRICSDVDSMEVELIDHAGKPVRDGTGSMVRAQLTIVERRQDKVLTNLFSVSTAIRNAGPP